jgi:phage terminase small subunit
MLTAKQEQFVKGIIDGMSQADAYRYAYDTSRMADKTVHEKASRLMSDGKVRARVQELRGQMMTPSIMSAQDRLEWLTELIQSDEEGTGDKLKAIDLMNKMTGEYVQRVVADVSYEDSLKKVVDEDEY